MWYEWLGAYATSLLLFWALWMLVRIAMGESYEISGRFAAFVLTFFAFAQIAIAVNS